LTAPRREKTGGLPVEAAANVPGVRVVDSELEYEPDYYSSYRYGEERHYGDGYYPYYPYLTRPSYAEPETSRHSAGAAGSRMMSADNSGADI
jgi:hypothetical protein